MPERWQVRGKPKHNGSALMAKFGPRICPICRREFVPAGPNAKYCFGCRPVADRLRRQVNAG